MDAIKRDQKKRGTIRSSATKLIKRLEEEIEKETLNVKIVEDSLAMLLELEKDLSQLDREIENQITDEKQLETEVENSLKYRESIVFCKSHVNRRLRNPNGKTKLSEHSDSENSNSVEKETNRNAIGVKLPKLVINKFNGEICEWQNFWSQYEVAIHENDTLNDVDKFNYLKTLLSDSALISISGLSLMAENYSKAIDILKNRFGKIDIQINAHMNRLLNLEPVRKSNDLTALRKLYDDLEIHIRSLESLNVTSDSYGCLLCPILFKIIPYDLVLEFNRHQKDESEASVNKLLTFLKTEIESREKTASSQKLTKNYEIETQKLSEQKFFQNKWKNSKMPYNSNRNSKIYSSAALNAIIHNNCLFCGGNHKPEQCCITLTEKKELLRKQGRCFVCLKRSHLARKCRSTIKCEICDKRHHSSMCEKQNQKEKNDSENVIVSTLFPEESETKLASDSYIYLQTLKAYAEGKNSTVKVRLLLDTASSRSFIEKRLSNYLDLSETGNESLNIHTFGTFDGKQNKMRRVKIKLRNIFNGNTFEVEALETEKICADIIRAPNIELCNELKKMKVQLSDTPDEFHSNMNRIDILIGTDFYWKIVTGKTKRLSSAVVLNETVLGWTLHGRISESFVGNTYVAAMHIAVWNNNEDKEANTQIKKFWDLEILGVQNEPTVKDVSDSEALKQFETSVKFKNDRYEVKLPLKFDVIDLPDNFDNAKRRFVSLVKKFRNNPSLFEEYKLIINEYISLGIVEEVKNQDVISPEGNLTYYLPHHPVIRKDKQTTKLRIVFDGSSHVPNQPSLNDILLSGPNLNVDLFDLLIKFRNKKVAIVADLEKAFLQISLAEEDRDCARFLWIDELPHNPNIEIIPKIMKMTRVLFGLSSSPFLLSAVIRHHLKKFEHLYPHTSDEINVSMYVDDLLAGANTVDEALTLAKEAKEIFLQANMSLRKWQSNSAYLKEKLRNLKFDVSPENSSSSKPFKILGLLWDTNTDVFKIDVQNLVEFVQNREKTKRVIIQASGRIFDPIGILSPFTIRLKILLQSLWERGVEWDDNLPDDIQKDWECLCAQIPDLSEIELPRYYFYDSRQIPEKTELHVFSDASEKAYGAIVYLRFTVEGVIKTSFVTSKCRLSPIKRLSLPRLELLGALIGSRLAHRLIKILKINPELIFMWTDSNIVLHWIRSSSKSWKPFVSNRVSEIQSLTNPKDWRHCSGRENPADLLTRGISVSDLAQNNLWWSGPPWLTKESSSWSKETRDERDVEVDAANQEARPRVTNVSQHLCVQSSKECLLNIEKFSSLNRIIRIVGWIKRFIFNCKNSVKRDGCLSAEELQDSEIYLIKKAQVESYGTEIQQLINKSHVDKNSKIYSLCPYLDDANLLRIGSRLNQGDFSPSEINPIILPKNERFTELVVMREHRKLMHSGVSLTLTQIRKRFWIPQGRQLIKRIINRCLICKKYNAKPANQLTGQLPRDRISESPPFSIVGLDFAGPIIIRTDKNNASKSYIVLFTCATTRAIHLELATDMTTKSFLLALRRFLSRRGVCKIIYSDNAKGFKSAERELQYFEKIVKEQEIQDFISSQGVSWKFIVERAPWWGGFYERLVKCVKDPLRKILGRALLTFEELSTILTEIEAVVNMRPLTYTTSDFGEPEPLTPAHFLQFGRKDFSYPLHFAELENKLSTKETLLRRKRYQTKLLKQLWVKWKEQYLFNLNSAHHFKTSERHRNLQIGDIVLVDGTYKSKLLWDLGIIKDVIHGRDSLIRACVVKTRKGLFRKPIQLLYPFELDIT